MSHISLSLVGSKKGQTQHSHCFVLQRKLSCSIKYVIYEIRRQIYENTIILKRTFAIAHCHRTGKTIFLIPQRGSKDCIQTTYWKMSSSKMRRGSNYELVVFLGCKPFCQFPYLTFVTKFEPLCGLKKKIVSLCAIL